MSGHDKRDNDVAKSDEHSGGEEVALSTQVETFPSAVDQTAAENDVKAPMKRKSLAASHVLRRLKLRNGRYYLDLRDLGKGREALIPEGESYATRDEAVALHMAAIRLETVLRPEHERYFKSSELTRTATLGDLAHETIEHMRSVAGDGYAGAGTILRYEQAMAQLFRALDQDIRADRLRKADVKSAIRTLRKTRTKKGGFTSASSMHQIITMSQLMFDYASDEGIVPEDFNPWRQLRRQDRPALPRQSRTDFLEVYEGFALMEACGQVALTEVPLRTMVSTYLHIGGRRKEVLGLEVSDIDFERKVVRFASNQWRTIKDYDERSVPLWPGLERELRKYLATRTGTSSLLFEGYGRDGSPQMITSFHKPLVKAKWAAASMLPADLQARFLKKNISPQVFRVTYCSARLQTLDGGKPVASWTVEKEMGHNSGKMIRGVYGRLGEFRHRSPVVEFVPLSEEQKDESSGGAEDLPFILLASGS